MRRAVAAAVFTLLVAAAPITGQVAAAPITATSAPGGGNSSGDAGNAADAVEWAGDTDNSSLPQRWARTVGGDDDDKLATGLKVDGGYLVVGWSNSSSEDGRHDGYVTMLDRAGETKWERTYGGPGTDRLFDVEAVGDGYLVVGMKTATTGGTWDGWVMKLGPNGQKKWERTYGEDGPEALWSVARSGDRIYTAGWKEESGSAEAWAMTVKPNGNADWSETYDTVRSGAEEYFNSVFVTDNGDVLLTGSVRGGVSDPADAWAVRAGDDGQLKWKEFYGGGELDRIHDATTASDGGFVLAGQTASRGDGEEDGWMLKIRGNGETRWERTYGTDKMDAFFGVHNDPDGGYVVSGMKHVLGEQGADGWVVKTDARGKSEWEKTYGRNYWDKFWPVVEGHGGGYLAIGESTSYGDNRDGWVVRIGGPAVAAIEDADANSSGTTVTLGLSPVRAVTLSNSNASGVLSVAERTNVSALSPPGDPLYAVTMDGPASAANGTATVEFTVRTDAVAADLSDVRVARQTADGWSVLETRVVSEANGTAVLSAETDVGSTLAVTSVAAPTASIDAPESVPVGESAELSASGSTAENGTLADYEWSVGGQSPTGETASVSFDSPGERTVNLTVTDRNGLRDTATATLVVNDRPEVSVQASGTATVGRATSFSADVADEVGNVTVTWQFGDASVTGESVEHSFGSPGTETVTVVVEDEYGARATEEVEVDVSARGTNTDTATTTGETGTGVPGFGVGAALIALVAAALLAVSRRD